LGPRSRWALPGLQQRVEPDLPVLVLQQGLVLVSPAFERRPSWPRTSLRWPLFLVFDQDLQSLALFLPKKVLLGKVKVCCVRDLRHSSLIGCTEHPWWRDLGSLQGAPILPNPQKRFAGLRAVQVVLGYL